MGQGDKLSPNTRRIAASMMVFALLAQTLYGLIQPTIVHAVTSASINPDSMGSWQIADTEGNGGSVNFVNGVATTGFGSAQFNLPNASQTQSLRTLAYGSTKLSDISTLSYDTYVSSGGTSAASLQLAVDKDLTDTDTSPQGSLVYSPYQNGSVGIGAWQHQNARDGQWWFTNNLTCSQASPCSLNTIITLYPHIGILNNGSVELTASNGSESSVSYVDTFALNDTLSNYEAITAPQLMSPANASTASESTLLTSWQAIPNASKYIYESYNNAAATEVRWSGVVTDTQKTEINATDGATIWWRVKAVDQQGNEGNWSELWSVMVAKNDSVGGVTGNEIVSGDGSGQTQELLSQLARLNEPFAVPNSIDTFVAPHIMSAIDTAGDSSAITGMQKVEHPVADQGVNVVAAVPTENGWKFFGILWYWWIVPVLLLGFVLARMTNRRREPSTFLYSSDQI